jgi:Tol biopolymer transport system component/DNA-binding winged helix-turn-helix (wHTH) protein
LKFSSKSFESRMSNEIKVLYQFEDFRLDAAQKCLWRNGDLVSLTPKALETLLVLIRHKGRVVEKDTLLNEVWADTFVEEATLAQNISTLRKVLGSQPDKQFIETIPRRGYRFVAEVKEIVADEEIYVVEKHRLTNLVATQEIHDSNPTILQTSEKIVETAENQTALAPSTAAIEPRISRKKQIAVAVAAAVALAALIGAWSVWSLKYGTELAASKFREIRFTRLVSSGNAVHAAISPDGKYLALANRKGGDWSLQIRQISNENTVEVIPPTASQYVGLTFSHDSQSIYYVIYPKERQGDGTRLGMLYKIPLLGGVPQHLATDVDSPVAIAPDNVQFAFVRNDYKNNSSSLIVAGFDGRPEKVLAARPMKQAFAPSGPAWSPNGKTISCAAHRGADVNSQMELLAINAETGEQKSFVEKAFEWVGQTAWLKDGSGVIFPAYFSDSQNLTDQVWLASYPGGAARPITNGITGFYGISLTSDSDSFVTIRSDRNSNFWARRIKSPAEEPQKLNQGFSEPSLAPQGVSITPEREVVFGSTKNGNSDIWIMNADGEKLRQLTDDAGADYSPDVSPDGKFIVFLSNRGGISNVWRANVDGSTVKQITASPTNIAPGISTDGEFVYYAERSGENMFPFLWKIPVGGGAPQQLTGKATFNPEVSPDGNFIACFHAGATPNQGAKLTILSAKDGALVKQFDTISTNLMAKISWSPDSRKIYFLKNQDGASAIYEQPIDSDTATEILKSKNEMIFRFVLSPDGETVFYESGNAKQDVMLVKNVE